MGVTVLRFGLETAPLLGKLQSIDSSSLCFFPLADVKSLEDIQHPFEMMVESTHISAEYMFACLVFLPSKITAAMCVQVSPSPAMQLQ